MPHFVLIKFIFTIPFLFALLIGRNEILSNICPGVHGMFIVKLAVALTIIGGVPRVDPVNGSRTRGECHMLMVGEPGTGKSQFLRYPIHIKG
jgi:DNA helicase MCM9